MDQNQSNWEQRSRMYGATLKSVLFKNMPTVLNEHIHSRHVKWILDFLKRNPVKSMLDVGCGYGRLTLTIAEVMPGLDITGFDISENCVKLYKEQTGKNAFQGMIEKFPTELASFDCILCVTVLMFVPAEQLQQAFDEMVRHLNAKGKIILIENSRSGRPFVTGFGLSVLLSKLKSQRSVPQTGGWSFSYKEIERLAEAAGARIVEQRRMPAMTIFILLMVVLAKVFPPKVCRFLFKPIMFLDECLKKVTLPTVYTAYLIAKGNT